MTKSTEGAGVISEEKMELEELALVRLMGGNWKPGCQVRTTAGSLLPFLRSSCDLGRKLVCLETDNGKVINLEAEVDNWMRNTSQQGKCPGGQSDTCK